MAHLRNVNPLEPLVTNYRKFFGDTAKIIYDVGTRDGHDAQYLKEQLNGQYIYAIDANPKAVELTKKNYPEFNTLYTAVSDYVGVTSFQQVNHEREDYVGCSSIYAEKLAKNDDFAGSVTEIIVPVNTMKGIIDSVHKPGEIIDVIKVDIEGYTWEFLVGLNSHLSSVKCLHLETEWYPTHDNHKNSDFIADHMRFNGFYLADKSYEWGAPIEDQVWINKELAVNNKECWI